MKNCSFQNGVRSIMANGMCSKIMGRNVDLVFNDDLTNECTAALSTWVINGVDFFQI